MKLSTFLPLLAAQAAAAFDYGLSGAGGLTLTDAETSISGIKSIFTGEKILVTVDGVEWEEAEEAGSDTELVWETFVDGQPVATGAVPLDDVGRMLPTSVDAGEIEVSDWGRATISVTLSVDGTSASASDSYEAYGAGVAIIPLLFVLVFAMTTQMVELSLFFGIFIGACIIAGNVENGFKATLETYILEALADVDHGYVYLFTLFLAGLVGMIEKSGGMLGFTRSISRFATDSRRGQLACFSVGIFVFFDDYANVLLAGETMRPLLDMLFVSREKLAFIVDATSAPIASLSPISSWVGFEVGLIQEQIDAIIEREGTEDIGIKTSGLGVFLESIRFRYYPIFMIVLMLALIITKRDFGPMLIAERKTVIYERTDGGDGKGVSGKGISENSNQPDDTPGTQKAHNMIFPVLLLIFFIFYLLVETGEIEGEDQSVMDKIEASNSYAALLWGTMGAVLVTLIFYLVQFKKDGELVIPKPGEIQKNLKTSVPCTKKDETEEESGLHFLMTVHESVEAFLYGMARIFPALIVLTLAWASGAIMVAVGADRLFSRWIVGGVSPESLPTLSFIISMFMALATGTSWGTMSILFPLIIIPTYDASGADDQIIYSVIAGVLSGSVAGDHMSPISDTTVLSALACDCGLIKHVMTQAPYVFVIIIVSVLLGTLPIGYEAWPNIVGILLGAGVTIAFVFLVCVPITSPVGRYDIFTEISLKLQSAGSGCEELSKLREDTIKRANGESVSASPPMAKNFDHSDGDGGDDEEIDHSDKANEEPTSSSMDKIQQTETEDV